MLKHFHLVLHSTSNDGGVHRFCIQQSHVHWFTETNSTNHVHWFQKTNPTKTHCHKSHHNTLPSQSTCCGALTKRVNSGGEADVRSQSHTSFINIQHTTNHFARL